MFYLIWKCNSWTFWSIFLGEALLSICRLVSWKLFLSVCQFSFALLDEWLCEILLRQENEFLQDFFGFKPKKKNLLEDEHRISSVEKVGSYLYWFLLAAFTSFLCLIFGVISIIWVFVSCHILHVLYSFNFFFILSQRMFKSPNSVLNKARTQLLNKQRMLSEVGFFSMKGIYNFCFFDK